PGSSPSIQLSWTPNSQGPAATDYNVYAGLTGTSRVLVGDTGGANQSYLVNNLVKGQAYAFVVTTLANGQESAPSNLVTDTPSFAPYSPNLLVPQPRTTRSSRTARRSPSWGARTRRSRSTA